MSAIPMKAPSTTPIVETTEDKLRRLESTWRAEVGFHSSATILFNHHAFQEIIAMGEPVVPILLADLERKPSLLVWALTPITNADPVPESDHGNIAKMCEVWVNWGKASGYRW